MLDFIEKHHAGESGYYADRKRGTVDVWHDSKRYVYRKPQDLRQFKNELREGFALRGCPPARVKGSHPHYTIETVC